MSEIRKVRSEELKAVSGELKCGDKILLSGIVYTARDAAHKRFNALLDEGKELPIPLKDAVIYYAGPTPAPEGKPIGSCGPTTSGRMDRFAPRLLDLGLGGMIGKGERSQEVRDAVISVLIKTAEDILCHKLAKSEYLLIVGMLAPLFKLFMEKLLDRNVIDFHFSYYSRKAYRSVLIGKLIKSCILIIKYILI